MFAKLYISLLFGLVSSQSNGEFWWLNKKVTQLYNVEPPQPKIEDISEFETDESVKIIFRDVSIEANYETDNSSGINDGDNLTAIYFQDRTTLAKPNSLKNSVIISDKLTNIQNISNASNAGDPFSSLDNILSTSRPLKNSEDVLNFVFPEDNELEWEDTAKINFTNNYVRPILINTTDEPMTTILFKDSNKVEDSDSESICTFINAYQCLTKRGDPYSFNGRPVSEKNIIDDQIVCCILPMKTFDSSKIQFPDMQLNHYKRFKRSNSGTEDTALKQRNALMRRKYPLQESKPKSSSTTTRTILTQRVVTPEDYLDPYWNIKNSKFRNPSKGSDQVSDSKYDYSNQEYADDYAVEIPKPGGLVGLYSDHSHEGWSAVKPNKGFSYSDSGDISEEGGDGGIPFGYSTIDPRLGKPVISKRKLSNLKISSYEDVDHSSSQVISFRSKPDFQVMQGFKLLNLARNGKRLVRKTTTAGSVMKNGDEDISIYAKPPSRASYAVDYEDFVDLESQVYRDCGKSCNSFYNTGKEMGQIDRGSSPWLTLVVLTRSRQSILCYATLVHPRAAVTAADCVYGTSPGEISIITGAFDLTEENTKSQHRLATVITHPQYKAGQLSNNLAILHWHRPLKLGRNVQPACMSDPHLDDNCYFVGWGGYDEGIQQRPHWQRASILSPKICDTRLKKLDVELPTDAFCASVDSSSTVTGVGGPLLCTNNGRQSIVGVAVWRDSVILTLPVLEWTARMVEDIVS